MSEAVATIISDAEAALHLADPLDARLAALANAAAILDWPLPCERDEASCHASATKLAAARARRSHLPCERDEATCHELARLVDALLVRGVGSGRARSRGG
jgi:hypothetical protein